MMQTKPLVSIIVPVYKVEPYLEKCVRSLTAQTLSDIEIILVDDGSPDRSGEMCEQFAREDSRITVYHKQNGGLSDARNYGVERAKADLVGFVDSDDHVAPDMYDLLYKNLVKENADVSMCGTYSEYTYGVREVYPHREYFTLDAQGAVKLVLEGKKISVNAVNKLYKKSLFENVRYPVGKLSEDAFVIVDILSQTKKVVVDTSAKYYYVHREDSITTSVYKEKDQNVIEAYTKNLKAVREKFPEIVDVAEFRYFWAHFYVLDKMVLTDGYRLGADFKRIAGELKKSFLSVMQNKNVGRGRKISMCALMIHRSLYKAVVKKYWGRKRKLVG